MRCVFFFVLAIVVLGGPMALSGGADEALDAPNPGPIIVHVSDYDGDFTSNLAEPSIMGGGLEGVSPATECIPCEVGPDFTNWVRAEYLLWWTRGQDLPPLVTTSPDNTPRANAGVLGVPGTDILLGDERVDQRSRSGGRITIGHWLDNGCRAIEAHYFAVGDADNAIHYSAESSGLPILARPYLNVTSGQEASELVAFPSVLAGRIDVDTSSELHSTGVLYRRQLDQSCGRRIDFLAGYRYLRLREGLQIAESLTSTDTGGAVPLGTQIALSDAFVTENDFHGGEVGISAKWYRGVWTAEALGKLAIGNVHQQLHVHGDTIVTVPGSTPFVTPGGLLTQPSNIGRHTNDEFAILPEINVNVRCQLTCSLAAVVGYSFVYLDHVLRVSDQIDRGVNATQLGGGTLVGAPRPAVNLSDSGFWVQGLNVGVEYEW